MQRIFSCTKLFALALVLLSLGACNASAPVPTVVAVIVTPSAVPAAPTAAPTAMPMPTSTGEPPVRLSGTSVPPASPTETDTPTVIPPTATNTPTHVASPTTMTCKICEMTKAASRLTSAPTTPTPIPPTAKPKPALAPTAVAKLFSVDWKTGMEYIPQSATRNACQMHNQYRNNSQEEMPFQNKDTLLKFFFTTGELGPVEGYEPIFGLANPDGSMSQWKLAGWYARAFGWSNGIAEFPPQALNAGAASDDWTWYSIHNKEAGQWCRYVYVKWKGQISAAEYSAKGDLINTNAKLPPGAP